MIEQYLEQLWAELDAVGIRGRLRKRILLETEEHLRSDPNWRERFGPPALVADRFADELATTLTRRAAATAIVALALAGAGYTVLLALADRTTDFFVDSGLQLAFALSAAVLVVLAPQLAFVAGVLAALRTFRRRHAAVMPAEEIRLVRRQTATALVAGLVTVAALAVLSVTKGDDAISLWIVAPLALPLTWAAVRFGRSARLRPQAEGPAGDAYDDLGPLGRFRRRPWMFCLLTALLAALAIFAAAALAGQPWAGLLNALFESSFLCMGFWLFAEPLGLTPSR
jgi:hypothetical protein